jgi:hypothetical protein
LARYQEGYAAYYQRCKHGDSPAMRDPNPTVILIPGVGMIAWGKSKYEYQVTAEFYGCAIEVMRGAEAIDEYVALPEQEAFDIEYWQLEEAKLRRMPPEEELSRSVVQIAGDMDRELVEAMSARLAAKGAAVYTGSVREGVLLFGGVDYTVSGTGGEVVASEVASRPARSNTLRVGKGASIEDQVEAVLFLLSSRSRGIVDQVISIR